MSNVGVKVDPRIMRERRGEGVRVLEADDEREEAGDDMMLALEECPTVLVPFYTVLSLYGGSLCRLELSVT
jgi:hypothetical protein